MEDKKIVTFLKWPLKILAIILVKILQKIYKNRSTKRVMQTSVHLSNLILIQSLLFYFKSQFSAWGFFHPSCIWSNKDEVFFDKLFPKKDFEELDIVVEHNPEAVTYYHNKIFVLSNEKPLNYKKEIKQELVKWKKWN